MAKILVAFFSHAGENYVNGDMVDLPVGNTEVVARAVAQELGADLFKIERAEPYPAAYRAVVGEARKELQENARPALAHQLENADAYDAIILGYPNWCGTMPFPVLTFLDSLDLAGKTVAPFCTNEGSGLGRSVDDLRRLYPAATVTEGLSIHGAEAAELTGTAVAWARRVLGQE